MKRGYTKEWFLNRCDKIKSLVSDVRISTDIIVGFPGESEKDFDDTLDVVKKVKFDQIFNFVYSPRPNTPAALYSNQVDKQVANKRLQTLIELHKIHQKQLMDQNQNKIMEVYFEELKSNGEVFGYSNNFIQVFVKGSEELLGQIKKVKITQAFRTKLVGEIIE
jgi:tRNA-2-methylthio-N6-dimethylallyladenosine synthase